MFEALSICFELVTFKVFVGEQQQSYPVRYIYYFLRHDTVRKQTENEFNLSSVKQQHKERRQSTKRRKS